MKLTKVHFVAGGGLLVAGAIGLILATRGGDDAKAADEDSPHSAAARAKLEKLKNQPMQAPALQAVSVPSKFRSFDQEIIDYLRGPAPAVDTKDALPKLAAQVDVQVFTRKGENARFHRIMVDVDRDGRPDEWWKVDQQGQIMRRAMRPDAETRTYRDVYFLEGDAWGYKGGGGGTLNLPEPTAEQRAAIAAGGELRPIDKQILELAKANKPGKYSFQQPDGKTAQIVLLPRRGMTTATAPVRGAQVDLDGDGKPDEAWTVGGTGIRRTVMEQRGNDGDERNRFGEGRFALVGDKWKKL